MSLFWLLSSLFYQIAVHVAYYFITKAYRNQRNPHFVKLSHAKVYGHAYVVIDTPIHTTHAVTMQPSMLTLHLLPVQTWVVICDGFFNTFPVSLLNVRTRCKGAFVQVITSSEQPLEGAMVQIMTHDSLCSISFVVDWKRLIKPLTHPETWLVLF